jgi:hypothetical protein
MATVKAKRREHGEDAIYFDAAKSRYIGAVSLGYGSDGRRVRRTAVGWLTWAGLCVFESAACFPVGDGPSCRAEFLLG